jgi:hypothetical protein
MVIIVMLGSICFVPSKCYGQMALKTVKGEVLIQNAPKGSEEPIPNLAVHKQFDVEILRMISDEPIMGGSKQIYSIRYFIIDYNDSLNYRKAWICTDENFDKAMYQWTNDSTVAVRMYNSINAKADTVELFFTRRGSGMKDKRKINFQ